MPLVKTCLHSLMAFPIFSEEVLNPSAAYNTKYQRVVLLAMQNPLSVTVAQVAAEPETSRVKP